MQRHGERDISTPNKTRHTCYIGISKEGGWETRNATPYKCVTIMQTFQAINICAGGRGSGEGMKS